MSPQIACGILRGLVIGVLVGLLSVVVLPQFVTMGGRELIAAFLVPAIPVWLGFLGFSGYDQHRAATGHVLPSDVTATKS